MLYIRRLFSFNRNYDESDISTINSTDNDNEIDSIRTTLRVTKTNRHILNVLQKGESYISTAILIFVENLDRKTKKTKAKKFVSSINQLQRISILNRYLFDMILLFAYRY